MAQEAQQALDWKDEHADEIDAGGDDGEGWRRARQIVRYAESNEPLPIEYWQEIDNYHSRHHAQNSHELDAEHRGTPWQDSGYISHLTWGGDPGYRQAQRVMRHVDSVDEDGG